LSVHRLRKGINQSRGRKSEAPLTLDWQAPSPLRKRGRQKGGGVSFRRSGWEGVGGDVSDRLGVVSVTASRKNRQKPRAGHKKEKGSIQRTNPDWGCVGRPLHEKQRNFTTWAGKKKTSAEGVTTESAKKEKSRLRKCKGGTGKSSEREKNLSPNPVVFRPAPVPNMGVWSPLRKNTERSKVGPFLHLQRLG